MKKHKLNNKRNERLFKKLTESCGCAVTEETIDENSLGEIVKGGEFTGKKAKFRPDTGEKIPHDQDWDVDKKEVVLLPMKKGQGADAIEKQYRANIEKIKQMQKAFLDDLEDEDPGNDKEAEKALAAIKKKAKEMTADKAEKLKQADAGKAGEQESKEPKLSAALLDLIDKAGDRWDKIRSSTKDKSLQKAMDYVEEFAVAERLKKS